MPLTFISISRRILYKCMALCVCGGEREGRRGGGGGGVWDEEKGERVERVS